MTFAACLERYYRFFKTFVLCVAILGSNNLFAQGDSYDHGVQPWRAERAIKDYMNMFIYDQREVAQKELPNDQFYVRVKIERLTRVYNKESGWIWIAQFSGAILPRTYDESKEQDFYHGILKIYADKNNDLQVVTNEGEGLWKMSQRTSILYQDLPEAPGGWKEWGGDPTLIPKREDPSNTDSSGKAEPLGPGLGLPSQTRSDNANDALRKKYDMLKSLQKRCKDVNNPNIQKDCEEYQKLYQQMNRPQ
jgi:hypothetical protein